PPCCLRSQIPPHPRALSSCPTRRSSDLPKGKMIEGRSGGSWRGTRRELWAPPDSGSAQPTDRRFVSCTDSRPEPFTAPPSHFLPPPLPHPSHLPAGHGEKFCRTQADRKSVVEGQRVAGR